MCALKLQKKRFGFFFFLHWNKSISLSEGERSRHQRNNGESVLVSGFGPGGETNSPCSLPLKPQTNISLFFFLYVCDRTQTRFQTHPSHPTGCNLNVAAEKKASGAVEPLGLEPDCRVRQHTTATHFLRHSSLMSGFLRNVQEDAEKWGWFAVGVVCGAAAT